MTRHGHQRSDARNLALHRLALDKLAGSPELRSLCQALLERWLASPDQASSRRYLLAWQDMLATWPVDAIRAVVLDPDGGQPLRQCSPLGPTLTPRERWRALAEVNREMRAAATATADEAK